jgi:hypothetical protein
MISRLISVVTPTHAPGSLQISFPRELPNFIELCHFFELESLFVNGLPVSILEQILANASLKLTTEDSLYDLLSANFERGVEFVKLLEHVRFEFLSASRIRSFAAWSCNHFDEFEKGFSPPVWRRIAKRIAPETEPGSRSGKMPRYGAICCPDAALPHDGIIAYLTRECGGNVHDRGVIEVTGSDVHANHLPRDVVDLTVHNCFHSPNQPDQWICYNFKDRRIRLTNYSIAAQGNWYLRSWIVEGSVDGHAWICLDEQKDNTDASPVHPIATFSVETSLRSFGSSRRGGM